LEQGCRIERERMTPNPTELEAGPEQPGPAEAPAAATPVKKKRNLPGTPGEFSALPHSARAPPLL
jgi:hypothetical protein